MKIEELDSNFKPMTMGNQQLLFSNVLNGPYSLEGFPWGDPWKGEFYRLPKEMKAPDDVNEGALTNAHTMTSGGCVRFRTDSPCIAIRAHLQHSLDMNHMPRTGSAGFDLYVGASLESHHVGSAQPNPQEELLERIVWLRPIESTLTGMQEWILNFPLYGGVKSVEIGLAPGATLLAPLPHAQKPILFYGSSITQGGCASRPGNQYAAMLCREVDAELVNLGFSGCGCGEIAVAKAIASLDLGAFVMDYDHNAPTADHLQATHEPFFQEIRRAHPHLPILLMSRCNVWPDRIINECERRREIILATYERARASGDQHVYWIDGKTLFGTRHREACTVDGCHPNDLGFYRMFETVLPVLQKALQEGPHR